MAMICENISRIKEDISLICQKLERDPQEVIIVGVTKFASAEMVQEAIRCGISHIGENKVQEASGKFTDLQPAGETLTKHMIGHLQTNKVRKALEIFDIIQSVDSFKLASAIDKYSAESDRRTNILVQVNTSGEKQKFGIPHSEALTLIAEIANLATINILGLMTIAPFIDDKEVIRDCFRKLKELRSIVSEKFQNNEKVDMKYLSMGMTDDYRIALEEGANMVRIGRAMFK